MKRLLSTIAALVLFWSSALWASASITSLPAGSYTGTVSVPPGVLPSGSASTGINIECSQWIDPASTATVTLEISEDGGSTWRPWCSGLFTGGAKDIQGNLLANATMGGAIPAVAGLRIRGTIVVIGTPLVTQGIAVEAF